MTFTIASDLDAFIVLFSLVAFILAGLEMLVTRGRSRIAWAVICIALIPLIRRVSFGAA